MTEADQDITEKGSQSPLSNKAAQEPKAGSLAVQKSGLTLAQRVEDATQEVPHWGWIYRAFWLFFQVLYGTYFRLGAVGKENVPTEGGFLLAVNHASFLDPMLVGTKCSRPLHYMARRTLFRPALWGLFLRNVNSIPLRREGVSKDTIRTIGHVLAQDKPVLIFPEGTRTHDGEIAPFRGGIIRMAQMYNVPILPVYLDGTFKAMGRGKSFPRPCKVKVCFGEPVRYDRGLSADEGAADLFKRIQDLRPAD